MSRRLSNWIVLVAVTIVACTQDKQPSTADIAANDRGVAQMGRYEYDAAQETFAAVVESVPGWLDARVNLAIATLNRQQEGDEARALEILGEVLEEDPENVRALYMTAIIYLYLGEPERSATLFETVTTADPEDAYTAYFLGQSLLQAGNVADAAKWLERAIELDPYLRSAYWAAAQTLRRQGQPDRSDQLLEDYQRFAPNPAARVAAFAYRRMGPKGDALAVAPAEAVDPQRPSGELFAPLRSIEDGDWSDSKVTAADINHDGHPDLFLTTADATSVMLGDADGAFARADEHPLTASEGAHATMWGDIDDDGLNDVVFCKADRVELWLQTAGDEWNPSVVARTGCAAGAVFDADHDGDLDIFVVGAAGNELLSNNRDGTFRKLAESMGLRGTPGRQVVVADLDADRDIDILVVGNDEPNQVWQNDRTWQYRRFPQLDDLRNAPLLAATAADANADGRTDIFGLTTEGELILWRHDGSDWNREVLHQMAWQSVAEVASAEMSVADFDGDGRLELLVSTGAESIAGITLIDAGSGDVRFEGPTEGLATAITLPLEPQNGPAIVSAGRNGIDVWPAGPGRYAFLTIAASGRSEAEQMRSNASGLGTRVKVRTAGQWTVLDTIDPHSGPGQSLLPLSAGLRGFDEADFVALEWSDGVSQTEIGLAAGQRHDIAETQRQLASCPVVFAWNGDSFEFVSDVLGVGGMGFFIEPGFYAPPRPFESYLLDGDALMERDGRYVIKLTEPMEENAYLDAVRIHVLDVPDEWSIVLDERMGVAGPEVTARPISYRQTFDPVKATAADGSDVTEAVLANDLSAPSPGEIDHRFIGLLAEDQVLTIEFDEILEGEGLTLVADGWIEYPYSQTVFSAWQAGVGYHAATLEARGADGLWVSVMSEFGYPAGMPRKMALPLGELPAGTTALRLSSNMEIYWDRLQVVREEPLETDYLTTLEPLAARVARTGFAKRTTGPQRLPYYDYGNRSTYWDAKYQEGFYTAFGDALELVAELDGAVAIIGGGEEVHMEFPAMPGPAAGMKRYFALDFRGWAKDMDLYTEHGETVGPLPMLDGMDEAMLERRDRLHAEYNVRFQEGL